MDNPAAVLRSARDIDVTHRGMNGRVVSLGGGVLGARW